MKKLCIFLPNISHAGLECRGNIPAIAKKHGFECVVHDYDRNHFHEHDELEKIKKTIRKYDYTKVVVISSSFGDLVARKLLKNHSMNITCHISLCGAGRIEDITRSSNILLHLARYVWKHCYNMPWLVKKVAAFFNRETTDNADPHAHVILIRSAQQGMNKGLAERARYMLSYKESAGLISTPAYVLFSEDDNNFFPQRNAEHIAEMYENAVIISLGNAGHGSSLEMPDKYDPELEDIFGRIDDIN